MGGGIFEDANVAIRFLMQYESLVPDPGIEKIEEMEQIIRIVKDPRPLNEQEKKKIEKLREETRPRFCHRCNYCQPCTQGIAIGTVLNVKSLAKRLPLQRLINRFGEKIKKAEDCTECRECIERCPYNLCIPELLKESLVYYRKLEKNYTTSRSE